MSPNENGSRPLRRYNLILQNGFIETFEAVDYYVWFYNDVLHIEKKIPGFRRTWWGSIKTTMNYELLMVYPMAQIYKIEYMR